MSSPAESIGKAIHAGLNTWEPHTPLSAFTVLQQLEADGYDVVEQAKAEAWKDFYDELRRWLDAGYSLMLLERDGENVKMRPVA